MQLYPWVLLAAILASGLCFLRGDSRSGAFILGAVAFVGLNALLVATTNGTYYRLQARVAWLVPFALYAGIASLAISAYSRRMIRTMVVGTGERDQSADPTPLTIRGSIRSAP
jgi:hypothetical protein